MESNTEIKSPRSPAAQFLQDTSVHGFNNIINSKSKVKRTFWSILVMISVGLWITTLVRLVFIVDLYALHTVLRNQDYSSLYFPTITICPACPADINKVNFSEDLLKTILGISTWKALRGNNTVYDRNKLLLEFVKLKPNSSINFDDIILQTRWNKQFVNSTSPLFQQVASFDRFCFVFNGASFQKENGRLISNYQGVESGLEVIVDSRLDGCPAGVGDTGGIEVYLHDDDVAPQHPNFIISPGVAAFVELTKREITYKAYPYKAIGGTYCNDDLKYSRAKCVHTCITQLITETCNCVPDQNIENITTYYDKCGDDFDPKKGYQCWLYNKAYLNNEAEKRHICNCSEQCVLTEYHTSISYGYFPTESIQKRLYDLGHIHNTSYARNNLLKLVINFKTFTVKNINHEPVHTSQTAFGVLGGQLGFYLGASALSLIEVLEAVVLSIWCGIKKMTSKKGKLKVHNLKQTGSNGNEPATT